MFMLFDGNKQRLAGGWAAFVRAAGMAWASAAVAAWRREGATLAHSTQRGGADAAPACAVASTTCCCPVLPPPALLPPCAVGDIYPEGVQLKKGDYVIRAILRHDDAGLLEKLKVGAPSHTPLCCRSECLLDGRTSSAV